MFIIKADTAEEMREQIVKWLSYNASGHRIRAAKISGMHKKELELARASTYEASAKFIDNITIQRNS